MAEVLPMLGFMWEMAKCLMRKIMVLNTTQSNLAIGKNILLDTVV